MMPFRTQPELGRWCVCEGGWRVVKQLLLMSYGPLQTLTPSKPGGVFIPTADG